MSRCCLHSFCLLVCIRLCELVSPEAGAAGVTDRGWGIFHSAPLCHEAKFGVLPPCEGHLLHFLPKQACGQTIGRYMGTLNCLTITPRVFWGLNQRAVSELLWGCLLVWFLMSCLELCNALYSPGLLIFAPFTEPP